MTIVYSSFILIVFNILQYREKASSCRFEEDDMFGEESMRGSLLT
jgi:hypothetical protein